VVTENPNVLAVRVNKIEEDFHEFKQDIKEEFKDIREEFKDVKESIKKNEDFYTQNLIYLRENLAALSEIAKSHQVDINDLRQTIKPNSSKEDKNIISQMALSLIQNNKWLLIIVTLLIGGLLGWGVSDIKSIVGLMLGK
jgi:DNA repair ATPase RecN